MTLGGCLAGAALTLLFTGAGPLPPVGVSEAQEAPQRDPAAWGADHVGRPLPDYTTGDECLFCHRADVGPTWDRNPHQRTTQVAAGSAPLQALGAVSGAAGAVDEVTLLLGGKNAVRFLKPNGSYGQFALLRAAWFPSAGELRPHDFQWDNDKFADSCAGCHTTAVDSKRRAFSSPSLDCFTCHGAVAPEHTKDTSVMIFAKSRQDPPAEVISTCGQCHIRTGRSKSTGLPYPNQFVAGDNLFRDFEVDLSDEALARQGPADRHVLENVRAVVLDGDGSVTCLTCHGVHDASSTRHSTVRVRKSCSTCHPDEGSLAVVEEYEVHSPTCEY